MIVSVDGEEAQFLQRPHHRRIFGMALDIGIELGGVEGAAQLIGFQLGHVDAIGGEAAHRLVERGGHILHPEDKAGDHLAVVGRVFALARHDQKARHVVMLVLDIGAQNLQAIEFARQRWRRCAAALGSFNSATCLAEPAVSYQLCADRACARG